MVVSRQSGDNDTDDHLYKLGKSNKDWVHPLGLHLDSHQEVVTIHHSMYGRVNSHEDDTGWSSGDVGIPGIEEDSDVMPPVEENKWLLVDDDEKCVEKFSKFTPHEKSDPQSSGSISVSNLGADTEKVTRFSDSDIVQKMGCDTNHATKRKD